MRIIDVCAIHDELSGITGIKGSNMYQTSETHLK